MNKASVPSRAKKGVSTADNHGNILFTCLSEKTIHSTTACFEKGKKNMKQLKTLCSMIPCITLISVLSACSGGWHKRHFHITSRSKRRNLLVQSKRSCIRQNHQQEDPGRDLIHNPRSHSHFRIYNRHRRKRQHCSHSIQDSNLLSQRQLHNRFGSSHSRKLQTYSVYCVGQQQQRVVPCPHKLSDG